MTLKRRRLMGLTALAWLANGQLAQAAPVAESLKFAELYKSRSVLGMAFSERTVQLSGKPVELAGYMAPPLKPESNFFVLTRTPVSVCPFCSSDADWPIDIVVVYLRKSGGFLQDGSAVSVSGVLQTGSKTDSDTGFVSQLRILDAVVKRL